MSDTETSVPDYPAPDPLFDAPAEVSTPVDPEVAQVPGDADAVAAVNASAEPVTVTVTEPAEPAKKTKAKPTKLEADLKIVVDGFVSGTVKFEGNGPTPHNLARAVQEYRKSQNPDDDSVVSSGAVSAALARWKEIGAAVLTDDKPLRFVDWTLAARELGITALKANFTLQKKDAKQAAKGTPAQPQLEAVAPAPAPVEDAPVAVTGEPGDQVEGFIAPDFNS